MTKLLETVNSIIWGAPALTLILGVGLYLTLRTGFAQLILFPKSLQLFISKLIQKEDKQYGVSPFQALCTALAATVGTGNLAGVAGAIAIGGPGSVFWMWICAVFGMITKFAEAALAVRYQVRDGSGYAGGPMYMIECGLGKRWKPLAAVYCFFGVVAAFGVGNCTQINAVVSGFHSVLGSFGVLAYPIWDWVLGIILAALIVAMLLGGAKRVGTIAELLVPFAAAAYILLGCLVLVLRWDTIPDAFAMILQGAFSPAAVTGGMLGSAFQALRVGVSRGVFTNEAGMGTASMAHGSAHVKHPIEQGLMGIVEVFLDTVVICTLTALVILVSGVEISYGLDEGLLLTTRAFTAVLGNWAAVLIALETCCFAFATVLGWGLYGARCAQYLFGQNAWKIFAWLQGITVILGAVLNTGMVWTVSEIVNGLMAIPNLVALAMLSPELIRLTKEYRKVLDGKTIKGGTYEYFNQCEPL